MLLCINRNSSQSRICYRSLHAIGGEGVKVETRAMVAHSADMDLQANADEGGLRSL